MAERERTLFSNEYFVITLDADPDVVKVTRLEAPLTTPGEAVQAAEAAFVAMNLGRGTRNRLLFDLSRAPGRNDPEFERAMNPVLARHLRGFSRIATVVRSAAGKLQVRRVGNTIQGQSSARVFFTEAEARAFLRTGREPGE